MSQKMGKRTRKHAEHSPQSPVKNDEVKIKDVTNEDDENRENGTKCEEFTTEDELQTKEVEDLPKSIETDDNTENLQSTDVKVQCEDIIETENTEQNENAKVEQVESEGEMEPLVLDEQSNGVQILIESTVEITETEKSEEDKKEGDLIVNGESHSNEEEISDKDKETEDNTEEEINITEDIDGRNSYNLKDTKPQSLEQDIYSDTLEDVSTTAVVGSDTTRYEENFEYSKFLTVTKDQSVGESLRHLSARRSIRTMRNYFPLDGNTYNLSQIDVRKRKCSDNESQDAKRTKQDSPGLMSYLGYPFKKPDVTSSTPKLTGYRESVFDKNVSKISLNNSKEKSANKWCSVM